MKNFIFLGLILVISIALNLNAQAPNLQWQKSLGGSDNDDAFSIVQTTDGGYLVAGQTASNDQNVTGNHGEVDSWVVKLNPSGNIQWQHTLGGTNDEAAYASQQTSDGGYVVAGQANSTNGDVIGGHGSFDAWVVKLDANGIIQWQNPLGGSGVDYALSIAQTIDGGYIVGGQSDSKDGEVTGNHGGEDDWIVKLDANGNLQWEHSYGGSGNEAVYSIQQTADGGFIAAGNSTSKDGDVTGVHDIVYGDMWIIKLDNAGNLVWQKAFGGSDYDQANSIQQTSDGGFIAAGWSRSTNGDVTGAHGNYDMWIVKLDMDGNLKWQKTLGGSSTEYSYSIQQTPDGGYITAGLTSSNNGDMNGNHGESDFWTVKLDKNGNLQWQEPLGGNFSDEGRSIDRTSEGGYIVTGFSNSDEGNVSGNHGNYDFWVAKLFSCNCIPPIDGLSAGSITASSSKVHWDTVACVTGYKIRYRTVGSSSWTTQKVNSNTNSKKLTGLIVGTDYEWEIASKCSANPNSYSSFSSLQTFTTASASFEKAYSETSEMNVIISPNPSSGQINLDIKSHENSLNIEVVNYAGQIVLNSNIVQENEDFHEQFDISVLPSGIYCIVIKSGSEMTSAKFVKQ
ncbi:MAG: T9SS type A sorting domain-containing protein [Chitinophagales bacterium]|nr:T9SS type A sorting domain-containing protein [Chitinophagales bacterium]